MKSNVFASIFLVLFYHSGRVISAPSPMHCCSSCRHETTPVTMVADIAKGADDPSREAKTLVGTLKVNENASPVDAKLAEQPLADDSPAKKVEALSTKESDFKPTPSKADQAESLSERHSGEPAPVEASVERLDEASTKTEDVALNSNVGHSSTPVTPSGGKASIETVPLTSSQTDEKQADHKPVGDAETDKSISKSETAKEAK